MASQPPQLPESLVLGQFRGIKNTVSRERLDKEDFEVATNIDLDDSGQARRRRGYTRKDTADFHSLRTVGSTVYGVRDGVLGIINADYTFTSLATPGGAERISYTQVADTTYYSSQDVSGKITGGNVRPWGQVADEGVWLSPVLTPTDTLGAVFGKQIHAPPMANYIAGYKGRIYLAAGPYMWATELFMYDYVDKTKNFMQFESDITMLAAMNDGLYVGTTTSLWFLQGTLSEGFRRDGVLDFGVIPGSDTPAPTTDTHPGARGSPMAENMGVMFMTTKGVSVGFDGGQVFDLTRGRVEFPHAVSAAALYREDSGVSSYVAVTNSAGGPAANARIGDFVDAEIVRRGG